MWLHITKHEIIACKHFNLVSVSTTSSSYIASMSDVSCYTISLVLEKKLPTLISRDTHAIKSTNVLIILSGINVLIESISLDTNSRILTMRSVAISSASDSSMMKLFNILMICWDKLINKIENLYSPQLLYFLLKKDNIVYCSLIDSGFTKCTSLLNRMSSWIMF